MTSQVRCASQRPCIRGRCHINEVLRYLYCSNLSHPFGAQPRPVEGRLLRPVEVSPGSLCFLIISQLKEAHYRPDRAQDSCLHAESSWYSHKAGSINIPTSHMRKIKAQRDKSSLPGSHGSERQGSVPLPLIHLDFPNPILTVAHTHRHRCPRFQYPVFSGASA